MKHVSTALLDLSPSRVREVLEEAELWAALDDGEIYDRPDCADERSLPDHYGWAASGRAPKELQP